MGTKVAVAFANIFLAKVETELLNKTATKMTYRCIDDGHRKRGNNTLHNHNE